MIKRGILIIMRSNNNRMGDNKVNSCSLLDVSCYASKSIKGMHPVICKKK